jgi:hypothetical protein
MEYSFASIVFAFTLTQLRVCQQNRVCHCVFSNTPTQSFLSLALGFPAGVMIYVSFIEISSSTIIARWRNWPTGGFLGYPWQLFWRNGYYCIYDKHNPRNENPD